MKDFLLINILLMMTTLVYSQNGDEIPYATIPEAPEEISDLTILVRMIDGLGFRYHWATEGLHESDLGYRISEDARTFGETMDHLLGLAEVTHNALHRKPNVNRVDASELSLTEKRASTLHFLHKSRELLMSDKAPELSDAAIIFVREDKRSEFPIWNLINGPLADALTHVGQLVSWRRANGNPQPAGVNVFTGEKF
ncbi:MAG: hypothetical protein AAFQ02_00635 [Bacteroidota bacterium]